MGTCSSSVRKREQDFPSVLNHLCFHEVVLRVPLINVQYSLSARSARQLITSGKSVSLSVKGPACEHISLHGKNANGQGTGKRTYLQRTAEENSGWRVISDNIQNVVIETVNFIIISIRTRYFLAQIKSIRCSTYYEWFRNRPS